MGLANVQKTHTFAKKVFLVGFHKKKVINIKHSVYYINFNDGFGAGKCPKDNSAKKLLHQKNELLSVRILKEFFVKTRLYYIHF